MTLSSNNSNITVPASVAVASGQTSAAFTATVASVTTDQNAIFTAALNGASQTFTLAASAPAQLSSISCSPSTLGSNASSTCTVTLNKAAISSSTVSLASSSGVLTIPASVTVAASQSTATFAATTAAVPSAQSVTVTASLNGINQSATIGLAVAVQPGSLSCSPATVNAPGTSSCTVSLTAVAPSGGSTVALSSNNANITVPGSTAVPAGQTSAVFTVTVASIASDQAALLTASLNGASQNFTLSASAPAQLSSLSCSPSSMGSNSSTTCIASLNKAAATTVNIALASNKAALTVPPSLTIPVGSTTASFSATTATLSANEQATVTASANGQTQTATVSLTGATPQAVQLTGLSCTPSTLSSNGATVCSVAIGATSANTTVVTLSTNNNALTIPASVAIPAGQTSATFNATLATLPAGTVVTVTAGFNGQSQNASITVAGVLQLSSIVCAPSGVNSPGSSTCTVSLSGPAQGTGFPVTLASNNTKASVPASVTVPTGSTSAGVTVTVAASSLDGIAVITASADGVQMSASLSFNANVEVSAVNCAPTQLAPNSTALCVINLSHAPSSAFSISLSANSSFVTIPPTVMASAGQTSINFQALAGVPSSQQTVSLTIATGGTTAQTTVSIMPGAPPVLAVPDQIPTNAWVTTQFTVTASDPNGLTWKIASSALPMGATFDSTSGKFQWAPDLTQTGATSVTFTVTDSATLSSSKTVVINVGPALKAHITGLYNAASYQKDQTCSPGSLATLVGVGFSGQDLQQATVIPWPTTLGGLRLTANGIFLPILAVTDTLIQFQCPILPVGSAISLIVTPRSGVATDPMQFVLQEATPALFVVNGNNQGAVLIAGTNLIAMPATDGIPSRPAKQGEYLAIYADGLGPVKEVQAPGTPAPLDHLVPAIDHIVVVVGTVQLTPAFAGLAPGAAGLYQVNVQLTTDVPIGDSIPMYVNVTLSDGTVLPTNSVNVAIQAADPAQ